MAPVQVGVKTPSPGAVPELFGTRKRARARARTRKRQLERWTADRLGRGWITSGWMFTTSR
jgi:hypothetical protein